MILNFLNSLFNLLCRNTSAQQQPQQPPEQYPQHVPHSYPQQVPPVHPPHHQPQQQYEPTLPPHRPHKPHADQNQISQNNEYYRSLRARANEEGDLMASCFERSHQAYAQKNGALAKELSDEGKEHKRKMEQLNREASNWIFIENNKDSKPGEIDLHGLYVKEAIARTDIALQEAKARGDTQVNLIVGKGLHSAGGAAKIKPAIEELMVKHHLDAQVDPENAGVLIVRIDARPSNRSLGPEEISRNLERKDEGCTIM